mmetsp:Transcript_91371/g.254461  ORF Transcript_91371/g.254461 Transcript_91371/m.254461 type:complete len:210 (+) Transcript_91371:1787-2416(+)
MVPSSLQCCHRSARHWAQEALRVAAQPRSWSAPGSSASSCSGSTAVRGRRSPRRPGTRSGPSRSMRRTSWSAPLRTRRCRHSGLAPRRQPWTCRSTSPWRPLEGATPHSAAPTNSGSRSSAACSAASSARATRRRSWPTRLPSWTHLAWREQKVRAARHPPAGTWRTPLSPQSQPRLTRSACPRSVASSSWPGISRSGCWFSWKASSQR